MDVHIKRIAVLYVFTHFISHSHFLTTPLPTGLPYIPRGFLPTSPLKPDIDTLRELNALLLLNYDTKVRPRLNQSHTIEVNTTFIPNSIISFDTTEQRFEVLGYFSITWKDELLTWTPKNFSNTAFIKLFISEIWKPTLILTKTAHKSRIIGDFQNDIVRISSDGIVQWVPESIYSVICEVNLEWYPFDEQTCKLTYYVSDETISSVALSGPEQVSTEEYIANPEWQLLKISSARRLVYGTYMVDIIFRLERRSQFTVYTLVSPLILLSILNTFVILMPIESGEKASLSITIFLSYGVLLTIIRDTLPHNSLNISHFIVYLEFLLICSVLTVVYVVMQSKIYTEYGTQPCRLYCYLRKKFGVRKVEHATTGQKPNNKKDRMKSEPGNRKSDNEDKKKETVVTWAKFLRTLDYFVFALLGLFLSLFTSVFFAICNARSND